MTDLPNQTRTWRDISDNVEEFDAWRARTGNHQDNACDSMGAYLLDQLEREGVLMQGRRIVNPVVDVIHYMTERSGRMQELMHAYMALRVANDLEPARRLIAGQRLRPGLHPEYVTATKCYGVD